MMIDSPIAKICDTCEHFICHGKKGDCTRYPPQACTVGGGAGPTTEWMFPEVGKMHTCGEWKDANKGAPQL